MESCLESCGVSVLGGVQDLLGQSPKQPGPRSVLTPLWAGGGLATSWDPFQPQLFSITMPHFIFMWLRRVRPLRRWAAVHSFHRQVGVQPLGTFPHSVFTKPKAQWVHWDSINSPCTVIVVMF